MPETFREQPRIITVIAEMLSLDFRTTGRLIDACLAAVDELLYDDHAIYAPPLAFWADGDPVIAALRAKRRVPIPGQQVQVWSRKDQQHLAQWLDLDPVVVARYPVASESDILWLALQWLCRDLDEWEQWPASALLQRLEWVLYLWLETFAHDRTYLAGLGPDAREEAFEDWLEARLAVLAELGYPVDPVPGHYLRRHFLAGDDAVPFDWLVADLVCPFPARAALPAGDDAAPGDWLVIESKTTDAHVGDAERLEKCCTRLQSRLAGIGQKVKVFGLLIADGATPEVREHLAERRLGYLTLSEIGYRRRNWRPLRKLTRGVGLDECYLY